MSTLALIKSNIAKAFEKIGKTNGTACPPSEANTFPLAYEYFVADQLASYAEKRKKAAKEACEQAGILEHSATPGNTEITFDSDGLVISAVTKNPSTTIDKTVLKNELVKALGIEKAEKILKAASKENKAPVSYVFGMK